MDNICADLLLLPQEAFADQITFRNLRRRPLHSKPTGIQLFRQQ